MRVFCLTFLLTMLLALGPVCAVHAAPVARIVAVVNGDMITARELDRAVEPDLVMRGLSRDNPADAAQIESLTHQVLEGMINEKILMQEAERLGIDISDERMDAEMERVITESQLSREEFQRQLGQQGLTADLLRARLRSNLISQQLIGRMVVNRVVVTDEEVADYYRQHMGEIPSGQVRVALLIYPAGEDARAWAGRIASGAISFEEAVRKVSVGPNPEGGGDLGFMDVADMASALRDQVGRLRPGDVSDVFDMQLNKAQIRLLESMAADSGQAESSLPDEETAARIEEIIRRPRLEARFADYTRQLRDKALVDIRY